MSEVSRIENYNEFVDKKKKVASVETDMDNGQIKWRPVYSDGTVGGWAMAGFEANVGPDKLREFIHNKLEELGANKKEAA